MKILERILILFSLVIPALAQNSRVSWSALDMGFEVSRSPNVAVKATIGQALISKSSQLNTTIESGFLVDTTLRGLTVGIRQEHWLPLAFSLRQNYPNPFNPATTISYEVPTEALVTLRVYNVLGQVVKVLVNGLRRAGVYSVEFDASRLASGVYYYRLQAADLVLTKKLVLLR